ncbi:transposase [Accumulibacter sp.]
MGVNSIVLRTQACRRLNEEIRRRERVIRLFPER